MRYMGSKRRIADEILPIILKDRKPGQWYVEPFCGGCNTLERVTGNRIGGDIHVELIAMYKALQKGWKPPKKINEDEYKRIMAHGSPELKGYAGFTHSFGGKYGSTYRRHGDARTGKVAGGTELKGHYGNIAYVGKVASDMVGRMVPGIAGVKFHAVPYYSLVIPDRSIIYCDPPYAGTTGYTESRFKSANFWQWCRTMADRGHTVFISEYTGPEDFKVLWKKQIKNHLNNFSAVSRPVVEKLFTI